MLGKVVFDKPANALERYREVIYHSHLQNLNGSLSKIKGPGRFLTRALTKPVSLVVLMLHHITDYYL